MDIARKAGNKNMQSNSITSNILVKINGENKSVPQNFSISNILELFKINKNNVVIELNRKIIKKDSLESITLNDNDELEVVTFVGGG